MNRTLPRFAALFAISVTVGLATPVQANDRFGGFKKNNVGIGQKQRAPSARSFRFPLRFKHKNDIRDATVGFPFRDSFGIGDGGAPTIIQAPGGRREAVVEREPRGLHELAVPGVRRPGASVVHVTEAQKDIGEVRAERRHNRYAVKADGRHFRFYRPNEAYDVRFPSVVYLDTR